MSRDTTDRSPSRRLAIGARSEAGAPPGRGVAIGAWALAVWALSGWALPAWSARAQDADDLFREGVTLREAGDSAAAVDRLRRAHRLDPAPRTTYNLAAALADHGRYVEAQLLLRHLVDSDDDDLLIQDAARALLEWVTPRIARLGIDVVDRAPGQRVIVDAREAGAARELALDPGAHRIEVRSREGTVLARSEVDLAPGERSAVVLRPVGAPTIGGRSEDARAPGAAAASIGDDETWMWVGLGAGIVVVIGAVIAAVVVAFAAQPGPATEGDLADVHVRGEP